MMKREMKDSGFAWLGDIPKNWNVRRVKDLYQFDTGFTPDTSNQTYYDDENGEDWACICDLHDRYVTDTKSKISDTYLKVNKRTKVKKGSLLYSFKLSVGTVAFAGKDLYTNEAIAAFKDAPEINLNFLYYSAPVCIIHNSATNIYGASILNSTRILNANIVVPPLPEQQAIADFLDAKCAEIDGLLADLDAEVKTLAEYKKSIIAETVTRGLNPNVPMKKSGIPWVGEMPSHWKVIANKYIMHKKKEIVPIYEGQDIISLSMNGVIVRDLDAGGKMPTTFNGYQRIYPGNLLMCLFDIDVTPRCIGLIKNDGLTSPAYSQFVMDGDAYAPYYYYFYLKMDNDKELVHLSKNMRHSLNEEQFGMIKTILPPKEEQKAIATYLDEKCAAIEQSIADKQTQIETLKSYKASLIYEYVTGKKQVI